MICLIFTCIFIFSKLVQADGVKAYNGWNSFSDDQKLQLKESNNLSYLFNYQQNFGTEVFKGYIFKSPNDIYFMIPENSYYSALDFSPQDITSSIAQTSTTNLQMNKNNFVRITLTDSIKSIYLRIIESNCMYFMAFFHEKDKLSIYPVFLIGDKIALSSLDKNSSNEQNSFWKKFDKFELHEQIQINNYNKNAQYVYLYCPIFSEKSRKLSLEFRFGEFGIPDELPPLTNDNDLYVPIEDPFSFMINEETSNNNTNNEETTNNDNSTANEDSSSSNNSSFNSEYSTQNEIIESKSSDEWNSINEQEQETIIKEIIQIFEEQLPNNLITIQEESITDEVTIDNKNSKEKIYEKEILLNLSKNHNHSESKEPILIDYKLISKNIYIQYDNFETVNYTVFVKKDNGNYKLFKTKDQRVNKQVINKTQPENYQIENVYLKVENSSDKEIFDNKIKVGFIGKYNKIISNPLGLFLPDIGIYLSY